MNSEAVLVLTNLPDRNSATGIAERLVAERLAACANLLAPCTSIYHWAGKVESATEVPLLIKTTPDRYAAVEQRILELHPYELPEIIQVPLSGGLPAYLQWIAQETAR
jgi:periplasmic divalent cation tolerance protein